MVGALCWCVDALNLNVTGTDAINKVNGIPKGEGTGSSKQTAKEEAARQAFYAMGWT
jgi:hypothetical protein